MKKSKICLFLVLALLAGTARLMANAEPNDYPGLIAWYEFEEASGTGITDSMYDNNAFITGNYVREEGGVFGKCMRFINSPVNSTYIRMFDTMNVLAPITSEVTLSFWWFGNDTSGADTNASNQGVSFQPSNVLMANIPWKTTSTVYFSCYTAAGGAKQLSFTAAPALYKGSWNHWALTRKSGVGGEKKIYVNGQLVAGGNLDTLLPLNCTLVTDARIGMSFNGRIDDYRIYSRCLSAEEINDIYKQSLECDPDVSLMADINGDCIVDPADLFIMASEWLGYNAAE